MTGNVFYFTFVSPQLKQLFKNRILKERNKETALYQDANMTQELINKRLDKILSYYGQNNNIITGILQ